MLKRIYDFISSNRLLTALFIAGIFFRLAFFLHAYRVLPVSTDEALPGLMAKHILDGEFPVVYWGQSYMGTVESFFQAVFIYLFGTIPFSVRVYPLLVGILFIFVTYRVANEMYGRGVALISLTLVSIPTVYLSICTSLVPPDNYLAIVLIGSSALLLLHRTTYKPISEDMRLRYHVLMGLLSGIGFWIHLLYIDYIGLILLFFFIQDKLILFRKRFWIFVLSFIIGFFPLILYNITHNFDTFTVAKGIGIGRAILNLTMLFKDVIPQLLGIKIPLYGDNWNTLSLPKYWGLILGAVYVAAFLYIIITRWKNILGFITLSLKRIGPTEMLLSFVIISIIIFIRSERANNWAVRYILPVFSVVPILLSAAIYDIWKRYKVIAGVMFALILIIQLYGNARVYMAWGVPEIVDKALDLPDDRPLIAFLESKGINKAYAHYWIADRLTYETGENIICARPYDERFGGRYKPRYTDIVDMSKDVAFIFHPTLGIPYDLFEENLRVIGGSYKKETIGPYTVFYEFVSPKIGEPLSPEGWVAESNYRQEDVRNAFDRDISSRWATKSPQRPGAYFILDMGRNQRVSGISMALGRFLSDFPRGVIVETSMDKVFWKEVVKLPRNVGSLAWKNGHPLFEMENGRTEIIFEPVEARYIKITQTSYANPFDWSIAELYVYEAIQ
ncbi:MAG: discoidin domain-containing protein [Nitrospirae bacterium]|nr:discoidin domain-containing protein [Nitrospirota bacterium]